MPQTRTWASTAGVRMFVAGILLMTSAITAPAQQASISPVSSGADPSPFPATPFGALARALVHSVDQGGGPPLRALLDSTCAPAMFLQWTPSRYAAMLDRLAAQSGGLETMRVRQVGSALRVYARARKGGQMVGIELIPVSDGAARLSFIGVHPMDASLERFDPRSWPHLKLSEEALADTIRQRLRSAAGADVFSGVVLVAKDDRIIVQEAFGTADAARNIPNTLATRFHVASITKTVTGVAVAQLVESGRLRFDDALARVLPEYPDPAIAQRVTIRQLLTHTSGIPDIFASPTFDRDRIPGPAADLFPVIAGRPLEMEPGSRFSYSNSNPVILRAVIERVTGQRYHDYLRANVYARAGMRDTELDAQSAVPRRALGYARFTETDPLHVEPRRDNESFIGRASALDPDTYLSAPDLFRFARALRTNRLLGAAMTDSVVTGWVDVGHSAPFEGKYGFGIYDLRAWGTRLRGHSGGGDDSGIDADMEMLWDRGYTVIVLSNYDTPAARMQSLGILELLSSQ